MIDRSDRPILVFGKTGQVAGALAWHGQQTGRMLVTLGRPDVDFIQPETIGAAIDGVAPGAIINAAAYTDLDGGQTDVDTAFKVNGEAPGALARHAAERGIPLIHLSTDCVFDGRHAGAHTETDDPNPLSVYGASKLAGERAVARAWDRSLIVRVCWVFSRFGGSFPRTMINLARNRDEIRVVSDQFGYPTHARDIANALITMVDRAVDPGFSDWGLYHLAGDASTDRATQAKTVLSASETLGGPVARVVPVSTVEFGAPAPRPANARLDASKAKATFGLTFGNWVDDTRTTVEAILEEPL